ncbi:MAG TPA: hypothetical protein VGA69_03865 [Nitriliruptorales bacterium]
MGDVTHTLEQGTSGQRRTPLTADVAGSSVRIEHSPELRFSSLSGVDDETLGVIANAELFDRVQRRRDAGLDDAVEIDEFIGGLDD